MKGRLNNVPSVTHLPDSKACDRSMCNPGCGRKQEGHPFPTGSMRFGLKLCAFCSCERLRLSFGEVPCPDLKAVGIWGWPSPSVCKKSCLTNLPPRKHPARMVASPIPLVSYISGVLRSMWGRTHKHLTHFDLCEI